VLKHCLLRRSTLSGAPRKRDSDSRCTAAPRDADLLGQARLAFRVGRPRK
jgi:hypothetical protein